MRTNLQSQPNADTAHGIYSPGWVAYGVGTVASIVAGVFRAAKSGSAAGNCGMRFQSVVSIPAATTVTLSAEYRSPPTNVSIVQYQMIARDQPNNDSTLAGTGLVAGAVLGPLPADNVWRRYFATFVVPAGRTMTDMYVNATGGTIAVGDYVEVRNIMIEIGPNGSYFDGATVDSRTINAWTGTAYNSTSTQKLSAIRFGTVRPTFRKGTVLTPKTYQGSVQVTE